MPYVQMYVCERVREFDDLQLLKMNIFDCLKYPSDLKIAIFTIQSWKSKLLWEKSAAVFSVHSLLWGLYKHQPRFFLQVSTDELSCLYGYLFR